MSERTSQSTKSRRLAAKAPPALLITASMFVFAVVTIALTVFGM